MQTPSAAGRNLLDRSSITNPVYAEFYYSTVLTAVAHKHYFHSGLICYKTKFTMNVMLFINFDIKSVKLQKIKKVDNDQKNCN